MTTHVDPILAAVEPVSLPITPADERI